MLKNLKSVRLIKLLEDSRSGALNGLMNIRKSLKLLILPLLLASCSSRGPTVHAPSSASYLGISSLQHKIQQLNQQSRHGHGVHGASNIQMTLSPWSRSRAWERIWHTFSLSSYLPSSQESSLKEVSGGNISSSGNIDPSKELPK